MSLPTHESSVQAHPAVRSFDDERGDASASEDQFLVFRLVGEFLALPLDEVAEIIRPPSITPMPLSAPALMGLISLRGRVMPVACLRALAGMEKASDQGDGGEELARILVLKQGGGLGLRVDQVQRVMSAPPMPGGEDREGEAGGLITSGTLNDEGRLIHLLDVARMLRRELGDWQAMGGEAVLAGSNAVKETLAGPSTSDSAQSQPLEVVLRVRVADQLFGIPATRVSGILEYPESISPLPRTPDSLTGVASLRGRNRAIFSLAKLLGLKPSGSAGHVILLRNQGSSQGIALSVDAVEGVLRLAEDDLDAVPESIARANDELEGLYRDPSTKALLTLINLDRFLDKHGLNDLAACVAEGGDARPESRGQADSAQESRKMQQFVVFSLNEQSFAARIEAVKEILRLPDSLTGVPAAEEVIEGVINLRGRVLPVVDLRRRFGLPVTERNEFQRVLVLEIQGQKTGFIVDSVSEVMKVSDHAISSAEGISMSQADWVSSVIRCEDGQGMVLVVDESMLLSEEILNTLRAVS